ncbi:MAG: glycosyltransferase family 39 protein [Bacteroidia bacterium]|nr:glycosyltransferase family 39 protein [Bacteroidia bacterium]
MAAARFRLGWVVFCIAIVLHGVTFIQANRTADIYQDDSVFYLTIAKNLWKSGTFSQSFFEPLIADIQRLPGYPIFLIMGFFSPFVVLLLQHILVFTSAIILYKAVSLYLPPKAARKAAWLFILLPMPIVFSNLLLSEILGIWGICWVIWFWAKYHRQDKVKYGVITVILATLLFYVKPIALAYLPIITISISGLMIYRRKITVALAVICLPILMLLPWSIRYYTITGKLGLSTLIETNAYYGRVGGFSAWLVGENQRDDAITFVAADSIACKNYPDKTIKTYSATYCTQETEIISIPITTTFIELVFQNPLGFCIWLIEVIFQQLSGLGYETSFQITHNKIISIIFAAMQVVVSGIWLLTIVKYFQTISQQPLISHFILVIIVLHFAATAVGWADGRFRLPIEPLLCVLTALNIPTKIQPNKTTEK